MSLNLKLIALSLAIIFLDRNGWLSPFKNSVVSFSLPFEAAFKSFGAAFSSEATFWSNIFGLRAENSRLKKANEDLESRLVSFKETERENALLREELRLGVVKAGVKPVLVRIIGRAPESANLVLVDRGSLDFLRVGDLAVYKNFIFGKVIATSQRVAKIELVTDPSSFFEAFDIESLSARGEVHGSFGTSLKMTKILPTEEIKEGETIVELKSGFILGKVARVDREGANSLKTADLSLPYKINEVEKVLVLGSLP